MPCWRGRQNFRRAHGFRGVMLRALFAMLIGCAIGAPPAGAVLVYQRPATGEVVAARRDGSAPHVITHGTSPVIAPSGHKVAFFRKTSNGDYDLRLVGIHGGRSRLLSHGVFVAN